MYEPPSVYTKFYVIIIVMVLVVCHYIFKFTLLFVCFVSQSNRVIYSANLTTQTWCKGGSTDRRHLVNQQTKMEKEKSTPLHQTETTKGQKVKLKPNHTQNYLKIRDTVPDFKVFNAQSKFLISVGLQQTSTDEVSNVVNKEQHSQN